jgi:hypothetical protein
MVRGAHERPIFRRGLSNAASRPCRLVTARRSCIFSRQRQDGVIFRRPRTRKKQTHAPARMFPDSKPPSRHDRCYRGASLHQHQLSPGRSDRSDTPRHDSARTIQANEAHVERGAAATCRRERCPAVAQMLSTLLPSWAGVTPAAWLRPNAAVISAHEHMARPWGAQRVGVARGRECGTCVRGAGLSGHSCAGNDSCVQQARSARLDDCSRLDRTIVSLCAAIREEAANEGLHRGQQIPFILEMLETS